MKMDNYSDEKKITNYNRKADNYCKNVVNYQRIITKSI